MNNPEFSSPRIEFWNPCVLAALFLLAPPMAGVGAVPETPSAWPQDYSVRRDKAAGVLTLTTPYYTVQHDLKRGGAISSINLTHGKAPNLLAAPFETRVQDTEGQSYADLADTSPTVSVRQIGQNQIVTVEARLRDARQKNSGVRVKTTYEYRWGYVKIRRQFTFPGKGLRLNEICPVSTMLVSDLCSYGYRDGMTEEEGAPPFSFGSCHWGTVKAGEKPTLDTPYVPRYLMLADPGVEGLEWFVSSDLTQWDLQLTGKRGQGRGLLEAESAPAGIRFSVSAFRAGQTPIQISTPLVFDYYLGLPLLEGRAQQPWFHTSFNRNHGDWVSADQVRHWAETGVQTVHCHNDGDYYGDGLFWRDGSYPPYPDMDRYDQVISNCHTAGIRVATYFSNKELHPSTPQFREHGLGWGRMNRKGELQHNTFNEKSEFGAQMCLHSGWLEGLKASIDRVLAHHQLDGVYYDWNVALLCCNPGHEKLKSGLPAAGHWDIDELLDLMEWTRRRVGPGGLVIVHNTTTPMFATENFADKVVANEWGYGKWSGPGPGLSELPLEWSLVGARSRGVISYGQLDANAPRQLHRLFALEALLGGVTPWPAGPDTFELFPILKPIGALATCRFADWRNRAVTLSGGRVGSAIYSRPDESWLVLGNLEDSEREVKCVVHPDQLPCPLSSIGSATLFTSQPPSPKPLDAQQLIRGGATLTLPAGGAVLLRVR